jgi:hypothetical protein
MQQSIMNYFDGLFHKINFIISYLPQSYIVEE